jgi:hypothetical protein
LADKRLNPIDSGSVAFGSPARALQTVNTLQFGVTIVERIAQMCRRPACLACTDRTRIHDGFY